MKGWLSGNRPQVVPASCPELPGTQGPCWLPGAPQHAGPLQVPMPIPHRREEHLNLGPGRGVLVRFTHSPPLQQTAADPDGERPTVGKAHAASVPGLLRGTLAPDGPPYPFSDLVTHPDAARRAPVHTDTGHVIPGVAWPHTALRAWRGCGSGAEATPHASVPLCWILASISYAIFFFSK